MIFWKAFWVVLLGVCVVNTALAHKVKTPIHQYITQSSVDVLTNIPSVVRENTDMDIFTFLGFPCGANYDWEHGDDAVIGAGEADNEKNPLCFTFEEPILGFRERCASNEGVNGFFEHFYDPDGIQGGETRSLNAGGYNCSSENGLHNAGLSVSLRFITDPENGHYDSAFRLAEYEYIKALALYQMNLKEKAFYHLGRVAHLIQDVAVPAHVHLVPHDEINNRGDLFESFFDNRFDRVMMYEGGFYTGEEYDVNSLPGLPPSFDWVSVHPNPSGLFKLFWYTAQKTQYYGTSTGSGTTQRAGNGTYTTLTGETRAFTPALWEGTGISPISDPNMVAGNIQQIADALIPHAMRATAGLFRLFMEDVSGSTAHQAKAEFHALNSGWVNIEIRSAVPAPLSIAIVRHGGVAYTVEEAQDAWLLYDRPYIWSGTQWLTSGAELDEWSFVPGRLYSIYIFSPLELWLITVPSFPRTSTVFEDPLL